MSSHYLHFCCVFWHITHSSQTKTESICRYLLVRTKDIVIMYVQSTNYLILRSRLACWTVNFFLLVNVYPIMKSLRWIKNNLEEIFKKTCSVIIFLNVNIGRNYKKKNKQEKMLPFTDYYCLVNFDLPVTITIIGVLKLLYHLNNPKM